MRLLLLFAAVIQCPALTCVDCGNEARLYDRGASDCASWRSRLSTNACRCGIVESSLVSLPYAHESCDTTAGLDLGGQEDASKVPLQHTTRLLPRQNRRLRLVGALRGGEGEPCARQAKNEKSPTLLARIVRRLGGIKSALGSTAHRCAEFIGARRVVGAPRHGAARQVTCENFDEACSEIERLLPTCAFYALDLEMTSLDQSNADWALSWDDSPEERYDKMRRIVASNNVIQVGICLFHEDARTRGLVARPYTIYVYPVSRGRYRPRISLDAAQARDFHANRCGLDFNKWIHQGVPFTDAQGEKLQRRDLELAFGLIEPTPVSGLQLSSITENDRDFVNRAVDGLDQWLHGEGLQAGEGQYVLPPAHPYMQRLLRWTVKSNSAKLKDVHIFTRPIEPGPSSRGGGGRFLLQSWQRSVVWIVTSRIVTSIGLRSLWNLWLWLLGFWLGTHVQPAGGGKLRTGGCCCCGCGCLGNGAGYGARLRLGGLRLRTGLWMGTCLKLMSLLLLLSCLGWRSGLLKGNLLLLKRYWLL